MTTEQANFIATMTAEQAARVIAKFCNDPETAARKSDAAYGAFMAAWEMVNPGTYWQRQRMATGTNYYLIDMRDGEE